MAQESRAQLKTYFQDGDQPSEQQFINLLDSLVHYQDELLNIASNLEIELGTEDAKAVSPEGLKHGFDFYRATQALAEAGTDNNKYLTSLNVLQAIVALTRLANVPGLNSEVQALVDTSLSKSANLSDLSNVSTALVNLGVLGSDTVRNDFSASAPNVEVGEPVNLLDDVNSSLDFQSQGASSGDSVSTLGDYNTLALIEGSNWQTTTEGTYFTNAGGDIFYENSLRFDSKGNGDVSGYRLYFLYVQKSLKANSNYKFNLISDNRFTNNVTRAFFKVFSTLPTDNSLNPTGDVNSSSFDNYSNIEETFEVSSDGTYYIGVVLDSTGPEVGEHYVNFFQIEEQELSDTTGKGNDIAAIGANPIEETITSLRKEGSYLIYTQEDGQENSIYLPENNLIKGRKVGEIGTLGTGNGQFQDFRSFDIDTDRNLLYGIDPNLRKLSVFDLHGNFIVQVIFTNGTGDGEFQTPVSIGYHKNEIYIYDLSGNDVQVFFIDYDPYDPVAASISWKRRLTSAGFSKFISYKEEIYTLFSDEIRVIDSENNILRDSSSSVSSSNVAGFTVANDKVYVSDRTNSRIHILNRDLTLIKVIQLQNQYAITDISVLGDYIYVITDEGIIVLSENFEEIIDTLITRVNQTGEGNISTPSQARLYKNELYILDQVSESVSVLS